MRYVSRQPGTQVSAGTLCVKTQATPGCYSTISAAVVAAMPGDTIDVAHGTYKETVTIAKSLSLIGEASPNTIIDAINRNNGLIIMGATDVVVSGFTVENANTAGIWVVNSSDVTISNNRVIDNDRSLVPGSSTASPACPALVGTVFEAGEAFDCGEGIFLSGVDHSIVASNLITGNAGGILLTDDTAPSHDNVITTNSVVRNTALDCGITLPSHSGQGVYHNTVSGNDSSYNGGPGVGIFAPGPGSKAYANVIVNNTLRGKGLPGVTMHNHAAPGVGTVPAGAPPVMFNDNIIVGNDISANQADNQDTATPGPTGIHVFSLAPMTGTVISQNTVHQETYDIIVHVPAGEIRLEADHFRSCNSGSHFEGCSR